MDKGCSQFGWIHSVQTCWCLSGWKIVQNDTEGARQAKQTVKRTVKRKRSFTPSDWVIWRRILRQRWRHWELRNFPGCSWFVVLLVLRARREKTRTPSEGGKGEFSGFFSLLKEVRNAIPRLSVEFCKVSKINCRLFLLQENVLYCYWCFNVDLDILYYNF